MSAGDNVIDLTGSSPASCNTPRSQIRHKYTDNKSSARDWPALSPSILLSSPLGRYCTQPLESLPIVNNEASQSSYSNIVNNAINDDIDVATGRLSNSISSLEANINNNQDDFYNLTPIRYDDDDDNNNFWTLTTHSDDDIAANDTGFNSTNTQNVFDDTTHRNMTANDSLIIMPDDTECNKSDTHQIVDKEQKTRKRTKKQMPSPSAVDRQLERIRKKEEKQQRDKKKRLEKEATLEIRRLNTKPDKQSAIRDMIIVLHNFSLLKEAREVVMQGLSEMACEIRDVTDQMLLASSIAHVTWRQRRTTRYNEEKQLFLPTSPNTASTEEEKPFVACILPISQFITKTSSSTDVNELMKLIHRSYAKYKPILIIHGFTAYLRKRDTIWHRWYAERVRNNGQSAREEPSEEELGPDQQEVERRLIDIQLRHRCLMLMIDQWSELARWISQYCGEMSIHSQRSVQSMAHGLPRVPTGKTASDTWRIMLEQVYSCSASAAMAISQRYPTPYALYTAYNACTSSQDAEQMLASLMVNYGPIGAQHARRLGPTLSRRIYRVFCSVNPDEIIS